MLSVLPVPWCHSSFVCSCLSGGMSLAVRFPSSGSPLLGRKRRNFDISGEEAGSDSDSHSSDDRDCKCTRCLQEDESHLRRRMHENVAAQLKDASRQLRQARQHLADAKDEVCGSFWLGCWVQHSLKCQPE